MLQIYVKAISLRLRISCMKVRDRKCHGVTPGLQEYPNFTHLHMSQMECTCPQSHLQVPPPYLTFGHPVALIQAGMPSAAFQMLIEVRWELLSQSLGGEAQQRKSHYSATNHSRTPTSHSCVKLKPGLPSRRKTPKGSCSLFNDAHSSTRASFQPSIIEFRATRWQPWAEKPFEIFPNAIGRVPGWAVCPILQHTSFDFAIQSVLCRV